ncbi:hypothetical protein PHYSODRAFT_316418 [Phytophthora sojae]|uniref:NmrA-like domain-containing protein n=1 Tax=Phytophthora sojae (strain P6497) TaxID=1094619 RepID=G4ZTC7_PHYSP|nr:hypothetical protein PHYSODRAFT_316418 [Phytophthora sojae]EGZ12891.1 hypothetical protein PHYSODRAFT_316418 [Phytophthora sojae]|eukprot:XP_009530320.1 hypothetical protein PHYSODRAFT_316418 [Phytophthora sojae]
MSVYTKFAIIGAGGVGGDIVDELLNKGDTSKPELQAFKARGATLLQVSYDDHESIKRALGGSEVAVSALSGFQMHVQKAIVPAAKEAGYGVPVAEGPNAVKKEVQDALKQHDLPFATFNSGVFAEFLAMYFGYHYAEGYMTVVRKGETPFSITARRDLARFAAHVLSTTPKSELAGARFRFEADRLSPMQIRALAEKKLNKKIEVRYVDFEENKKKFDTDFMAFLTTIFEDGRGAVGTQEEVAATAAKYFPDWNPAKYETFIQ